TQAAAGQEGELFAKVSIYRRGDRADLRDRPARRIGRRTIDAQRVTGAGRDADSDADTSAHADAHAGAASSTDPQRSFDATRTFCGAVHVLTAEFGACDVSLGSVA